MILFLRRSDPFLIPSVKFFRGDKLVGGELVFERL